MKQTKIIATMGPASSSPDMIEKLINAGVNVFRLNFSHGTHEFHAENIQKIRQTANKLSIPIAIMGDLQGPKIRVSKFTNNQVELNNGDNIVLDTEYTELGTNQIVGVDYKELAHDVKINDILLLDDGKITFKVSKVEHHKISCNVIQGGILKSNKGINKLGGGLTAPALTEKDLEDIKFIASQNLDYVAVSFPKEESDMTFARRKLVEAGSRAQIIAKIERTEAVFNNLEAIIKVSDGVMVARGDLAVEVGEALVPGMQKKMVRLCRKYHKISIVATQMLESMIENPVATRAEVSDIANAVLDGTDAVMLSAETASGKYPLQAVQTMSRVCEEAEKMVDVNLEDNFVHNKFANIQQTISMAALFSAYHMEATAILALTTSGATARWMSRVISGVPIYAITDSQEALQSMAMYRGVYPFFMQHHATNSSDHVNEACEFLQRQHILQGGDTVIATLGERVAKTGTTNSLKIINI
ncbi:MAG: pyruvate kinase [Pseudomonadota bacterium]